MLEKVWRATSSQKWIQSSGPAICSVRVLFFNALHKLSSLNIYIFFIFFFLFFLSSSSTKKAGGKENGIKDEPIVCSLQSKSKIAKCRRKEGASETRQNDDVDAAQLYFVACKQTYKVRRQQDPPLSLSLLRRRLYLTAFCHSGHVGQSSTFYLNKKRQNNNNNNNLLRS